MVSRMDSGGAIGLGFIERTDLACMMAIDPDEHRVLPLSVPYSVPLPSMMMKPNFLSSERRSFSASVWNLLSHR